jgi:hypothetical protein
VLRGVPEAFDAIAIVVAEVREERAQPIGPVDDRPRIGECSRKWRRSGGRLASSAALASTAEARRRSCARSMISIE